MTETITATDGQKKQIRRFVEDAVERFLQTLDKDGAQRLIERGNEFQESIAAAAAELSASDQFVDEETASSYGYLSGYKPKGIAEQVARLRELFPELKDATFDESITTRPLPPNAEGWFAIPRWMAIAPTYGEAVQKALDLISQTRDGKFYNYRQGQTGPEDLRQHAKTVKAFQELGDEQKGHDILIVPCQFGIMHRGKSVRRVREVMNANQFGLGAFVVGTMLLTHPERLQHFDDLWIDCAGDEFSPHADGSFDHAPFFFFLFNDGGVRFAAFDVSRFSENFGSASGFLPQ